MNLEMTPTGCAICGSFEKQHVVTGHDREGALEGEFCVVRCVRCGHHRVDPAPRPGQEAILYLDDYAPFTRAARAPAGTFRAMARRVLRWQQLGTTLPRSGSVIELGCGSGGFLAELQAAGWTTTGIEPNAAAAKIAHENGLTVLVGTDSRLDELDTAAADLVVANMVLEHLLDPGLALRRLHRVTRPGGRLLVVVPNFDSASRKRFGRDWFALQVPRHLQHFDPSSLSRLLTESGWVVEHMWHQPRTIDTWKSLVLRHDRGPLRGAGRLGSRMAVILDVLLLPALVPIARVRGASRLTVMASRRP